MKQITGIKGHDGGQYVASNFFSREKSENTLFFKSHSALPVYTNNKVRGKTPVLSTALSHQGGLHRQPHHVVTLGRVASHKRGVQLQVARGGGGRQHRLLTHVRLRRGVHHHLGPSSSSNPPDSSVQRLRLAVV